MNTCRIPPVCAGLKSQSTRQCSPTTKSSVSLPPVPCQIFVTDQVFPASAGADSASRFGIAAGACAVAATGARLAVALPKPAAARLSRLESAKIAATATAILVRPPCAFHQRVIAGHVTVSSVRPIRRRSVRTRSVTGVAAAALRALLGRLLRGVGHKSVERRLRLGQEAIHLQAEVAQDLVVPRLQHRDVEVDARSGVAVLAPAEVGRVEDVLPRGGKRLADLRRRRVELREDRGLVEQLVLVVGALASPLAHA